MKPLRAPWQVWGVIALIPLLWFLYEQPGNPVFDDSARAAVLLVIGALLLLWGSKIVWVLAAGHAGAVAVIFLYGRFEPMGVPSSTIVQIGITAATITQFALLVAPATMDWVGLKDRRVTAPPAAPTR